MQCYQGGGFKKNREEGLEVARIEMLSTENEVRFAQPVAKVCMSIRLPFAALALGGGRRLALHAVEFTRPAQCLDLAHAQPHLGARMNAQKVSHGVAESSYITLRANLSDESLHHQQY